MRAPNASRYAWRSWTGEGARVLRGASWNNNNPDNLLSSNRNNNTPDNRNDNNGFRVVLVGVVARRCQSIQMRTGVVLAGQSALPAGAKRPPKPVRLRPGEAGEKTRWRVVAGRQVEPKVTARPRRRADPIAEATRQSCARFHQASAKQIAIAAC